MYSSCAFHIVSLLIYRYFLLLILYIPTISWYLYVGILLFHSFSFYCCYTMIQTSFIASFSNMVDLCRVIAHYCCCLAFSSCCVRAAFTFSFSSFCSFPGRKMETGAALQTFIVQTKRKGQRSVPVHWWHLTWLGEGNPIRITPLVYTRKLLHCISVPPYLSCHFAS